MSVVYWQLSFKKDNHVMRYRWICAIDRSIAQIYRKRITNILVLNSVYQRFAISLFTVSYGQPNFWFSLKDLLRNNIFRLRAKRSECKPIRLFSGEMSPFYLGSGARDILLGLKSYFNEMFIIIFCLEEYSFFLEIMASFWIYTRYNFDK